MLCFWYKTFCSEQLSVREFSKTLWLVGNLDQAFGSYESAIRTSSPPLSNETSRLLIWLNFGGFNSHHLQLQDELNGGSYLLWWCWSLIGLLNRMAHAILQWLICSYISNTPPKCISRISYASHEGLLGGRASLLLEVSKFKLTPCAGIKPLLWLIFAELEVGCSVAQNRAYNLLNKIAHAILQWLICSYGLLSVKAADHRYHLYTTALNEASFVYQPKGTLRHIHNKCR